MQIRLGSKVSDLQETCQKSNDPDIQYVIKARFDRLIKFTSSFIIFLVLVIPTHFLYQNSSFVSHESSNITSTGILLVATLVFATVLFMCTKVEGHDAFIAIIA